MSNLVYSKDFTFYKYNDIKEFAKRSFYSKWNDLIEFNDILELFDYDTEWIKPNSEDQRKELEKGKVPINTASKLYDKLLNIHTNQYDKLSKDQKNRINVLNRPKKLNSCCCLRSFTTNATTRMW